MREPEINVATLIKKKKKSLGCQFGSDSCQNEQPGLAGGGGGGTDFILNGCILTLDPSDPLKVSLSHVHLAARRASCDFENGNSTN